MTFEELKKIGIQVWTCLENHPEINIKRNLSENLYSKIEHLEGKCPFCEYYLGICKVCHLYKLGGRPCTFSGKIYSLWYNSLQYKNPRLCRERSARAIRKAFERWEK